MALDELKWKAITALRDEEKQREWIEKGFDASMKEARKLVPAGDGELKAVRGAATYALDRIEKHKASLVRLGQEGLNSTITFLAMGDYESAANHAAALMTLRTSASWSEVDAAILGQAESGNQKKRELNAARKEVLDALKDIGVAAAKAALPFLLALV